MIVTFTYFIAFMHFKEKRKNYKTVCLDMNLLLVNNSLCRQVNDDAFGCLTSNTTFKQTV